MWDHAAVTANVAPCADAASPCSSPDTGALASGLSGKGRFPEIDEIVEALRRLLVPTRDLTGERLLVTAGPTREPIDPVRYISNRSSGKMGYGLATAALRRGAEVTLVSGPTALTPPPGAVFVPVQTAEEMREAVLHHLERATIVIKAAAVADYRAKQASSTKIKGKRDLTLELTPNQDILAEVAAGGRRLFIAGFAAETNDVAENAPAKLERKDRPPGGEHGQQAIGFEAEDNEVLLLDRWGGVRLLPRMLESDVADAILSHVSHPHRRRHAKDAAARPVWRPAIRAPSRRRARGARRDAPPSPRSRVHGPSGRRRLSARPRRSAARPGASRAGLPQVQALRGALDGRVRLRQSARGARRHRRRPGRGRRRAGAALRRARRTAPDEDARSPQGRAPARRGLHLQRRMCRPPGNRNPEADEPAAVRPFLAAKLRCSSPRWSWRSAASRPRVSSARASRSGKLRGRVHPYGSAVLIPTFHPAFLLRNPGEEYKRMAWEDLQLARREYDRRKTR